MWVGSIALISLTVCLAASPALGQAGRHLPIWSEAFEGVAGTQRVGPAFPILDPTRKKPTVVGSQSLFFVDADPVVAMNAFAQRARDRGFQQPGMFTNGRCGDAPLTMPGATVEPGQQRVVCFARYERADGTAADLSLMVCTSCPEPMSVANVVVTRYRGAPASSDLSPIADLPADSPTLTLSKAELRSQRSPSNAPLEASTFPRSNGARLAMAPWPADTSGLCTGADAVIWKITDGDPTNVFDRYAHNTGDTHGRTTKTTRFEGRTVTQRTGEVSQLTLVEGDDLRRPWMLATACTTD